MDIKTKRIFPARLTKPAVIATYRSKAPFYDAWAKLTETKARARSLALADITDGESMLEVAVGTGLNFLELLKRNPSGRIEGVDLTDAMLKRAQEKAKLSGHTNYHLQIGDAYQLSFEDSTFDVLFNHYMFDLLPEEDFVKVLAEFHRVLRPNGRIVLVNMAKGRRWHERFWELLYRISPTLMGGCRGVSLSRHLETAGFTDIKQEYISQLTFPSEVLVAKKLGARC